jgi:hypothetical protein
MKKPLILSLFVAFLSGKANAAESYEAFYKSLSASVNTGFSETILGTDVVFHGDFTHGEERSFLTSKTREYLELAKSFDKEKAPSYCKNHTDTLHLYFVPRAIINDREIMSFLVWSKWDNKNIYGAFDSTTSPAGTVTVFVSSTHSREDIDLTLKHELYHYWQFRNCQELLEKTAYEFEKYH